MQAVLLREKRAVVRALSRYQLQTSEEWFRMHPSYIMQSCPDTPPSLWISWKCSTLPSGRKASSSKRVKSAAAEFSPPTCSSKGGAASLPCSAKGVMCVESSQLRGTGQDWRGCTFHRMGTVLACRWLAMFSLVSPSSPIRPRTRFGTASARHTRIDSARKRASPAQAPARPSFNRGMRGLSL